MAHNIKSNSNQINCGYCHAMDEPLHTAQQYKTEKKIRIFEYDGLRDETNENENRKKTRRKWEKCVSTPSSRPPRWRKPTDRWSRSIFYSISFGPTGERLNFYTHFRHNVQCPQRVCDATTFPHVEALNKRTLFEQRNQLWQVKNCVADVNTCSHRPHTHNTSEYGTCVFTSRKFFSFSFAMAQAQTLTAEKSTFERQTPNTIQRHTHLSVSARKQIDSSLVFEDVCLSLCKFPTWAPLSPHF